MGSVKITDCRKNYGAIEVIHGISLDIRDREFVVLVGPSGCGKSTLLRMIAGLEDITDGEISIAERVVNNVPPKDRDIAMVFQNYALYPHLTVAENMGFGMLLRKAPKSEIQKRVQEAATILDLEDYLSRYPKQLSGGQRQRVAIARVMLKDAPILILDEATSALDSEVEAAVQEQLYDLMAGKTVVAIAHRLSTIAAMDRLVVMDKGRIVEDGDHGTLIARGGLYASLWSRQSGGFLPVDGAA